MNRKSRNMYHSIKVVIAFVINDVFTKTVFIIR